MFLLRPGNSQRVLEIVKADLAALISRGFTDCLSVSHRHLDVNKYVSEACGRAEF